MTSEIDQGLLRVGIFLGGPSSEREISLESGRHIYNHLDGSKYERVPIFVDLDAYLWVVQEALLWMNTTSDIIAHLQEGAEPISYEDLGTTIDFAYLGLHGKYVEDGCLQGLLEFVDIPYNGSGVLASALGMDKYLQRRILMSAGLHVPRYEAITIREWAQDKEAIIEQVQAELGFPRIVKPSREGCSMGLAKVNDLHEMDRAVEEAFKWDNLILVEEFLGDAGIEVTTTVLGNDKDIRALLPTETPSKGEFLTIEEKFLPGDARMITPPGLPEEEVEAIQRGCERAYRALGCRVYARVDAFWIDHKLVILEVNTLPGVTPSTCVFHQAAEAGMNPREFFDRIIELSLEAHAKKVGPL